MCLIVQDRKTFNCSIVQKIISWVFFFGVYVCVLEGWEHRCIAKCSDLMEMKKCLLLNMYAKTDLHICSLYLL